MNNTILGCLAERTCDIAQALWPSEPRSRPRQLFAKRTQAADQSAFQPNEPTRAAPSWLRTEAHNHTSGTRSTTANSARLNQSSPRHARDGHPPTRSAGTPLTRASIFLRKRWIAGSSLGKLGHDDLS